MYYRVYTHYVLHSTKYTTLWLWTHNHRLRLQDKFNYYVIKSLWNAVKFGTQKI